LEPTQEQKLHAEVEAIKQANPETRMLIRETASLLFFRYGETPTANGLYQLLRKGSMTTYTDELKRFWTDIRDRTELRLSHPDIPPVLLEKFGTVLSEVWALAQQGASASLEEHRRESDLRVSEAQEQARIVQMDADRFRTASEDATQEATRANQAREKTEIQFSELSGRHEEIQGRVNALVNENQRLTNEIESLRTAHEQKQTDLLALMDREKQESTKELSHVQQLLTASEETNKRLRIDIQREVDRSEGMRMEIESGRTELRHASEENVVLRERIAGLQSKLETQESRVDALLRRPMPGTVKRPRKRIAK